MLAVHLSSVVQLEDWWRLSTVYGQSTDWVAVHPTISEYALSQVWTVTWLSSSWWNFEHRRFVPAMFCNWSLMINHRRIEICRPLYRLPVPRLGHMASHTAALEILSWSAMCPCLWRRSFLNTWRLSKLTIADALPSEISSLLLIHHDWYDVFAVTWCLFNIN